MNQVKKTIFRLFLLITCLFYSSTTNAYDFSVEGIFYNIINSNQVEVTYNIYRHPYGSYSGTVQIPETVNYNNVIYQVTSIGYEAFTYSWIDHLTIPNSVTTIGENSFFKCEYLESIVLSNSLTSIGKSAFSGCSILKSIEIPNSVISIGERAFEYCGNLESVLLPNNLEAIPDMLLWGANIYLTSINIPSSVKTIGLHAFDNCAFTSITIPEGVLTIGEGAFQRCNKLSSVSIPSTVTNIGDYAFASSGRSIELVVSNIQSPFSIPDNVFYEVKTTAVLQVPKGTISNYQNYPCWTQPFGSVEEFDVVNNFSLSIKATGNGSVSYNESTIRNQTTTFTVDEGTSVMVSFSPDNGYRIKRVKVNDTDVTSSVSDNSYTISSISENTTLEVEFEAIPPTTYTLSIKAAGNGSASYNGATVKNSTTNFTVDEGTSATVLFSPDSGYRIKSVKVNDSDVTSGISDNSYTISSISENTTLEVEFEAIPPTTYTLSIKAAGNGSASYNGATVKNSTTNFTVDEGTSATVLFSPDSGYRIKSVKVNDSDVTSGISDNSYTIGSISGNTTLAVEFEAITYTLSIKATGNGSASYNGSTIKDQTSTFTVNEGTSATVSFSPDSGYKIKRVKVNDADVTSSVSDNSYTISNISANTTLEVEFEAIPPTTYTLSIKVIGNGSVSYNGTSVRYGTTNFSVNSGSNATVKFYPDDGYRIKSVKVNNSDVTSSVSNDQYTISNISSDTTLEVEYEADTYNLSIKATGNGSVSFNGITIKNQTYTVNVNGGSSLTISFTPDSGYRIKSVKVNDSDVTSSLSDNSYTISNISANTTLEVEFEAIPATTYTLSIKATGNGSASYNGTSIKNSTTNFSVNSGSNATVAFSPDDGYRIKSVKVNDTDVTSSVANNQYTISNISANTTMEVVFEANPVTLTIKATGNGSATYDGTEVRNSTKDFSVSSGTIVTVSFSADSGYRIKTVKVNNTVAASNVSTYQHVISNISANTTLEVEFEVVPKLTIKATGNGSATYNGTAIRENTQDFNVNLGTNATITFSPDSGYRIKSVKVDNSNVTSSVSDNQYTLKNITADVTIEVVFEADNNTPTVPKLTIKATGNGGATYNGTTVKGSTKVFYVDSGTNATVSFNPNNGYRIRSVKVGNSDVTSDVSDNQYTIKNITADVTLEVDFEFNDAPTTYTLTIEATGNGSVSYNGTTVKKASMNFSVNSGANATVSFNPDSGYRISSIKVNNTDVTSQVSGNQYTISNITANTTMEVTFEEDVNAITVDGVNYKVISQSDKTVNVVGGNYGQVLTVPASVTSNGKTWTVAGIETDALNGNSELAAVIWEPDATFNAAVSNPNLLLYVKSEAYTPASIQNVVVNGTASNIVLKEASSGNNFYCPQAFTAQQISYTHNYQMQTGIGDSRGWETIALPFDVQTITHATKGTIKPFANWKSGDTAKPFWLMELTGTGFVETGNIKAYTPYIISMPNNPQYDNQWLLNGKVTFAASGVTVGKTDQLQEVTYKDRTFVPNYVEKGTAGGFYALNVSNDYETNNSGMTDGSRFVLNMRAVHPFEAYMTTASNAAPYIDVFDDMSTGIHLMVNGNWTKEEVIYDLQGRKLNNPSKKGVYIINGKKKVIK